jgi:hypothetical protein
MLKGVLLINALPDVRNQAVIKNKVYSDNPLLSRIKKPSNEVKLFIINDIRRGVIARSTAARPP